MLLVLGDKKPNEYRVTEELQTDTRTDGDTYHSIKDDPLLKLALHHT